MSAKEMQILLLENMVLLLSVHLSRGFGFPSTVAAMHASLGFTSLADLLVGLQA
jgi:hypothetical protein